MPITPSGARPPGIPGGHPGARDKNRRPPPQTDRRSELVCRVKYCNTLPDIPFDPKFLACPFEPTRFINYKPTSLERNYKYELLTEHDLGIAVDLILPDAYNKPSHLAEDELDPKDEKLLEEDFSLGAGGGGPGTDIRRSQRHAKILSWMRRPDYISTEQTRYQPTTIEKIESKVGFAVRKKMGTEHSTYMDREAQIEKINKTFEDALLPIEEHHSKKGVFPESVWPVQPDGDMWKFPCAQVIFDSDPAPGGVSAVTQDEMMSQAMIRGVMDESGEQFVAYFLPTEETMEKRSKDFIEEKDYDDEGEYEYKMAREYNWNVKSKASKGYEENYFFVQREDGIYYNELETRVRLSKRRLKAGQQASNSKLVVRHRPLNKQEHKMQRYRERNLEPPGEEEEMSDDDEEEEEELLPETAGDADDNQSKSSRSSSRSKSRSKSRSRSASAASGSRSGSRSRSKSKSPSRSRSSSSSSRSKSAASGSD